MILFDLKVYTAKFANKRIDLQKIEFAKMYVGDSIKDLKLMYVIGYTESYFLCIPINSVIILKEHILIEPHRYAFTENEYLNGI